MRFLFSFLFSFKSKKVILIGTFYFLCLNIFAQITDEKINEDNQQIIEILSEETDAPFDLDTYLEDLSNLKDNPLDLNSATENELKLLSILTAPQIQEILAYRKRMEGFTTLYELQALRSFTLEDIQKILPFVTLFPIEKKYSKRSLKQVLFGGKNQMFFRYSEILEKQNGFKITDTTRQRFLGSPQRYYLRYRYNFGTKLSYGFTAEKDPGEEFFKNSQKEGFDFYSAHFFVRDVGIFKSIAIGDYHIKLGQGLAMWTGFGFRKTPSVGSLQRFAPVLSPYTSVNESNFLRGAATTIGFKKLQITGFVSYKNFDANISSIDSLEGNIIEVSSIQETGLHRTPNEIEDKNAIKILTTGGNLQYRFKNARVGINGVYNRLDKTLAKKTSPNDLFDFNGKSVANFSIDYSYLYENITFYGEAAINDKGGLALVNAMTINTGTILDINLLHRYYDKEYFSFQNNAFAESTSPTNETGFYTGIQLRLFKGVSLSSYLDFYKFKWLRFLTDAPSNGFDYFGQIDFSVVKNVTMYLRYRYETKESNLPNNDTKFDVLTDVERHNIRYHIAYRINRKITLQNRFEFVLFNNGTGSKENGYLIYQDLKINPIKKPLTIYVRYTLFDTESFNARLFAYENDVLYAFSIPALFDTGNRYYIMLKYDLNQNISFWLRFSQTHIPDATTLSSGLNEINGNNRSEIKAQIRIKF